MPRIPGQGPRHPAPSHSGARAAPGGLSASRRSSGRPRPSELRRWPGDGPGDGAGQRAPRIWPHRPIWAWLLPTADLDSVLVQEIGGQRPAKHGLLCTAAWVGRARPCLKGPSRAVESPERHSYCGPDRMLPGRPRPSSGRTSGGPTGPRPGPTMSTPNPPSLRRKQGRPAGAGAPFKSTSSRVVTLRSGSPLLTETRE